MRLYKLIRIELTKTYEELMKIIEEYRGVLEHEESFSDVLSRKSSKKSGKRYLSDRQTRIVVERKLV